MYLYCKERNSCERRRAGGPEEVTKYGRKSQRPKVGGVPFRASFVVNLATCQEDAYIFTMDMEMPGLHILPDKLDIDSASSEYEFIDLEANLNWQLKEC